MKPLMLLTLTASLSWAQEAPGLLPAPPAVAGGSRDVVLTLTLPVQAGLQGQAGALTHASAQLDVMTSHGWHVTQTTALGRTADDKAVMVMIVLDRTGGPHGMAAVNDDAPWAGTPAAPAKAGTYDIQWDEGQHSTVVLATSGLRTPVVITTSLPGGQGEVTYQGTAFIDGTGELEIDARGEPVPGMASYSPDSFSIHADGSVQIGDDRGQADHGQVTVEPTNTDQQAQPAGKTKPTL